MNKPIFTRFTGTPTARADAGLPPTAKIQLPIRVRVNAQDAMITNNSHHTTVIRTVTEPIWKDDAKIAFKLLNPSISDTLVVATCPVSNFVTPRFAPCNTKNVPNVTRNDGIPVRTTKYPFNQPIANANNNDTIAPTHMFNVN